MPFIAPAGSVLRPDLSGVITPFDMAPEGFIGLRLLPTLPVGNLDGQVPKWVAKNWFRAVSTKRAAAQGTAESILRGDVVTYRLSDYAHKVGVTVEDERMYGSAFAMEASVARLNHRKILLDVERDIAATLFNETNYPASGVTGTTVSQPWNSANGLPISDVQALIEKRRKATGIRPNALILTEASRLALNTNPQMMARFPGAAMVGGRFGDDQLRAAFGVEYVLTASALQDTTADGEALSLTDVWSSTYAGVCRLPTAGEPDVGAPCLGRTLMQVDAMPTGGEPLGTEEMSELSTAVDEYWDADRKVRYIRCSKFMLPFLLNSGAFGLLKSVYVP
jgi:hypothetical protein